MIGNVGNKLTILSKSAFFKLFGDFSLAVFLPFPLRERKVFLCELLHSFYGALPPPSPPLSPSPSVEQWKLGAMVLGKKQEEHQREVKE